MADRRFRLSSSNPVARWFSLPGLVTRRDRIRRGGRRLTAVVLAALLLVAGIGAPPSAAVDESLVLAWAKATSGDGWIQGSAIAVDATGAATVTGRFGAEVQFGSNDVGDRQVRLYGSGEFWLYVFVARYNPDGTLAWAKQTVGEGEAQGFGVAVDATGAATVTGRFFGEATFGSTGVGDRQVTLISAGYDAFVARYNPDGTLAWAKQTVGEGEAQGFGVAVDATGAATVTGGFQGSATFGSTEVGDRHATLTSVGQTDVFVARYNVDGTLAWAKQAGGSGADAGAGVAVDATGAATVIGGFQGLATFGSTEVGDRHATLTSVGQTDVFVARYNPDGTLAWARRAGGRGAAQGAGVGVDAAGAATVTGHFTGEATFGSTGVGDRQVKLASDVGSGDVFVARYNLDGTLAWAKRAGGSGADDGAGIAVDSTGVATVIGGFQESATFGSTEVGDRHATLTSAGKSDVFVARYNLDGTLAWAKQAGGSGRDTGSGVAVDATGAATVTGDLLRAATFGSTGVGDRQVTLSSGMFVARYGVPALSVVLWSAPGSLRVGTVGSATGRVSPSNAGGTGFVEVWFGTRWARVASAPVGSTGLFRVPLSYGMNKAGSYRFRLGVTALGRTVYTAAWTTVRTAPLSLGLMSAPGSLWVGTVGSATGRVSPTNAGGTGFVEVWFRDRWARIASAPVGSTGSFRVPLSYGVNKAGSYRFRLGVTALGRTVYTAAWTTVRTAQLSVELWVAPESLWVGTVGSATGRVSPSNAGGTGFVQVLVGSTWVRVASAPVGSTGSFRVPLSYGVNTAGSYRFRLGVTAAGKTVYTAAWTTVRGASRV